MIELGLRLLAAGAIFACGVFGVIPQEIAWKAAVALAGVSLFNWMLEAKQLKNSGVAGFLAIADCLILAALLGASGRIQEFGFLVLLPCAYAAGRFGANSISMTPLAASALIGAEMMFREPGTATFVQGGGVLALGLALSYVKPAPAEQPEEVFEQAPLLPIARLEDEREILTLRENYRKLRDAYKELEKKSRKDKIAAQINEVRHAEGDRFHNRLCAKLKELTGAESAGLYLISTFSDSLVIRAASDTFPSELRDETLRVNIDDAPLKLRHEADKAVAALKGPATMVANVPLTHRNKALGLICVSHSHPEKLAACLEKAEEAASVASALIHEQAAREAQRRRAAEAELLYEISSLATGAATPTALAERITRELSGILEMDHIGIFMIEGTESLALCNSGVAVRLLESMSFPEGQGIQGWLSSGAGELILTDARDDARCPSAEALKKRVGSFSLFPIFSGTEAVGYLTAATHSRCGMDSKDHQIMRMVAAEASRAWERLVGQEQRGLMTPRQFRDAARESGHLVYIEPLRREQCIETYGKPAFEATLRRYGARLSATLPAGAALCRRDEGDFVAYLPIDNEEFATSWANAATTLAAMAAVQTTGERRVPLAVKSRVAEFTPQKHQHFAPSAA